jgi:hypothetical protein
MLHQCLKYIENGKKKRIYGNVKSFGVHEVKFNDAQYFMLKPATEPGWSTKMASKGSLIEDLRYDVSSEEEEEEIKFNFKPKSAQSQKLKEELDEEVVFHFG